MAEPTAAELLRDPQILLALKDYDGFPAPKAFEGLVGAIVFNGSHFVTTPNMDHIWEPPNNPQMTFKQDMRLGDDDPLLWPQPFLPQLPHYPCIRRKPADLKPTALYHIVFYELQDCDCQFVHNGALSGLCTLGQGTIQKLRSFIEFKVEEKLTSYRKGPQSSDDSMLLESLHAIILRTVTHLQYLPMSRRQVYFLFAELQRYILEFVAAHDYITVYRPRMNGQLLPATEVARTIGAFVQSAADAEAFFSAGLPVWLIRPAKFAGTVRVDALCDVIRPQNVLCLANAYDQFRVFFRGPATSINKYLTFGRYSRNYLSFGDAFQLQTSTSAVSLPLKKSEPKSRQNSRPYVKPKNSGPLHRLEEPVHELLPPSLQGWTTALSRINTDPGRARLCGSADSKTASGYVVPNPLLFFGANTENRAIFFYNWLQYRSALLYRITHWRNPPLSGQMWRDLLRLAQSQLSTSSSQPTQSSSRREALRDILKTCTENSDGVKIASLSYPPSEVHWNSYKFTLGETPDTTIGQEIVWELSELNFRAELRSLDLHLHRHREGQRPPIAIYSREDEILLCLAGSHSTGIFVADIKMAGSGIAAANWMIRRGYILALKNVMMTWDGFQRAAESEQIDTTVRMSTVLNYLEDQYLEFENALIRLYVQFFFDCFGRPPTLPRRLDHVL